MFLVIGGPGYHFHILSVSDDLTCFIVGEDIGRPVSACISITPQKPDRSLGHLFVLPRA